MAGKNRRSPAARALEQKQFRGRAIPDKREAKLTREAILDAMAALGDEPLPPNTVIITGETHEDDT